MRRWLALGFVACAACYRPASLAECDTSCADGTCPSGQTCGADQMCHFAASAECSAPFRDAGADSGRGIDAPPGCRGTLFTACAGTGMTFINGSFTTTGCVGGTVVAPGSNHPELCVIAADDIEVQTVRITGPRPLVLVGRVVNVQQGAIVDIASHLTAPLTPGAGADPLTCPLPDNPSLKGRDAGGMQTGGGGAGGGFQTSGGAGGTTAVAGGVASVPSGEPTYVLGGCNGGDGGASPAAGAGATGGAGGGALYLVATQAITVDGTINASGAGAGPGTGLAASDAGGGGGGAGGLIALDAPSIDIQASAVLFALGGGGSSGGGIAGVGSSGKEPAGPGSYAASSSGTGGTGGGGSHPLLADPGAGNTGGGGGGGGGGAGFVIFYGSNSIVNTSNIAPAVIIH